jgi:hypothetical protein
MFSLKKQYNYKKTSQKCRKTLEEYDTGLWEHLPLKVQLQSANPCWETRLSRLSCEFKRQLLVAWITVLTSAWFKFSSRKIFLHHFINLAHFTRSTEVLSSALLVFTWAWVDLFILGSKWLRQADSFVKFCKNHEAFTKLQIIVWNLGGYIWVFTIAYIYTVLLV